MNVLWPWKTAEYLQGPSGELLIKHGRKIVSRYVSVLPDQLGHQFWWAVVIMILGILSITIVEIVAGQKSEA
jgi:hypothetical protein